MKIFPLLLLSISLNAVGAERPTDIHFINIPANVSLSEAVNTISQAATRRRWVVGSYNNYKLRISLNHHSYKAVLIFSFLAKEVTYTDLTQYLVNERVNGDEEWEANTTPKKWIRNLKVDITRQFSSTISRSATKKKFTHKNIVAKLEALKSLYVKKLITEHQYHKKRKEIMARY